MWWVHVWIMSYDEAMRMGGTSQSASLTATRTLGRLLAENPSLFKRPSKATVLN